MPADTSYFDDLYAQRADPWGFADRWYEQRRYQLTLAALPRRRYRSGYEPGCSIGVLSAQLATRCDRLLSADLVPAAVEATRARLAGHPHARAERHRIPQDWPAGPFDLIVLSELLYYLTDDELTEALDAVRRTLSPGGDLVVVHWRRPAAEHRHTGDAVHHRLADAPGLVHTGGYCDEDFRLGLYTRADSASLARSVAQLDGIVDG